MQSKSPRDAAAERPEARLRLRHPPACHMRSSRDFSRVYRTGVRVRGSLILLVAAPSLNPGPPRLGLSVGRKFSKKAVVRNRARRVFREAFRLARPELPPLDLVMIPMGPPRSDFRTPAARAELIELAARAMEKWERREQRPSRREQRG
ncbi:MAG: ribonuclease P protein component [Planctomycetes bacterium]|nr:ribonuclease P protein component [Planctomycetota bacterium]